MKITRVQIHGAGEQAGVTLSRWIQFEAETSREGLILHALDRAFREGGEVTVTVPDGERFEIRPTGKNWTPSLFPEEPR